MKDLDWVRGFALSLNKDDEEWKWTNRYLSDMYKMYEDTRAAEKLVKGENPLVYRFHEIGAPEDDGVLSFGITEVMPGQVGKEFFMTKGHFHKRIMTSEVYFCLEGSGVLMLENTEGDWKTIPIRSMQAVYVPQGYAHRSINTGNEVLRMFFVYDANAGHDYKTIETRGYRHLVVENAGKAEIIDNPGWN